MRIHSLAMLACTAILSQHTACSAMTARASIGGDVFFKMFEGKDEASLRKDAMWRLTELAVRFPGTVLADKARAAVRDDAGRDDPHAWIADTLDVIGDGLRAYPPTDANRQVRRELLLLLDYPLHVETGDEYHRALASFYRPFVGQAFKEIRAARVRKGLRVWHVYNMGFIVKSPRHTIAFDINPGEREPGYEWLTFLTESQTKELAKTVDIAFVSHWHSDHASIEFLSAMSAAGKRVVVPIDESFKTDLFRKPGVTAVRGTPADAPLLLDGVRVSSYPGFQGDMPCNVYVVDVDGSVVSQNGDNCTPGIYADIARRHSVDVALANCWSGTNEFVMALNPKLFITGHENELLHDVIHRVPYRNTFGNLDNLGLSGSLQAGDPRPEVLSYGESVTWQPDAARPDGR